MVGDKNKHRVHSITATIHCDRQNLLEVQHMGVASCIEKSIEGILPLLDRKFGKKLVRIDSLSIEVSLQNKQLSELDKLISKALADAIQNVGYNHMPQDQKGSHEFKNLSFQEIFFHFLRYGEMPWFAARPEWEKLDLGSHSFISELRRHLNSSSIARERLISQFSVQQVNEMLLSLYPPKVINELFQFTALVRKNSKNHSERFASEFRLQQAILKAFLDYAQNRENHLDFGEFLKHYWPSFAIAVQRECNGKHNAFLEFLHNGLRVHKGFDLPEFKNESLPSEDDAEILSPNKEDDTLKKIESLKGIWEEEPNENPKMVTNAGVILLHPFLKRFFNKVGLLENSRFIGVEHQQRGVCLLHHLATGDLTFPGEKLLLMKHLCNYPPQKPVPKELPISDFELEEIATVLDSAVQHWAALKSTSKEGLRVNFLQRKGSLEKDAVGHTLHVEGHAADVLLDQLPWGLSTVHLPWHPDLLTIKWR